MSPEIPSSLPNELPEQESLSQEEPSTPNQSTKDVWQGSIDRGVERAIKVGLNEWIPELTTGISLNSFSTLELLDMAYRLQEVSDQMVQREITFHIDDDGQARNNYPHEKYLAARELYQTCQKCLKDFGKQQPEASEIKTAGQAKTFWRGWVLNINEDIATDLHIFLPDGSELPSPNDIFFNTGKFSDNTPVKHATYEPNTRTLSLWF